MSKAGDYASAVAAAKRLRPAPFEFIDEEGDRVRLAEVDEDHGTLYIPGAKSPWLHADEARRFGRWILETFGESDEPRSALDDPTWAGM